MKTFIIIIAFICILINIILSLLLHNTEAFLGWFCAMLWFLIATAYYEQGEKNI